MASSVPSETATPPASRPTDPSSSAPSTAINGGTHVVRPSKPPAARPAAESVDSALGLQTNDRRFLTAVSVVLLVLMAANWIRITGWTPATIRVVRPAGEQYRFVLDVNAATWVEWMQLDGIGEILARRIVADRETNGPFATVESVQRVPGIGPKTFERIRAHLAVVRPTGEINRNKPGEIDQSTTGERGTSVPH